jgi:hypothetical protein
MHNGEDHADVDYDGDDYGVLLIIGDCQIGLGQAA